MPKPYVFKPDFLTSDNTIIDQCKCSDTVFDPYCVERNNTDGVKVMTTYFSVRKKIFLTIFVFEKLAKRSTRLSQEKSLAHH